MAYKCPLTKMKKLLCFILVLFTACSIVNAKKVKPIQKTSFEVVSEHSEKGKQITFNCFISPLAPAFLSFECINNTDERIFIEWENARLRNDKIIFGDDSRITMTNPKADEAVSAHGSSIVRDIAGLGHIRTDLNVALFPGSVDKELKKEIGKKGTVEVKIPIRFMDNHVEEFLLIYSIWYEMPSNE